MGANGTALKSFRTDWVKASTHPYSDLESGGYGYLWWTGDSASGAPQEIVFPKGSLWAEGSLGQYAVVVPSLDLIVVNRVDEKMTKRAVHKRQMAQMVRMVVAAAPANWRWQTRVLERLRLNFRP